MGLFSSMFGKGINAYMKDARATPGAVVLYVRSPEEFADGHIDGARNVPVSHIQNVPRQVPALDTPLFVYCLSGARSAQACPLPHPDGVYHSHQHGRHQPLERPGQAGKDLSMKVVIIGGVAGGATAAARLRRLDENAQIVMLERSGYVSYANCGLPYYVGGVITDRRKLTRKPRDKLSRPFSYRRSRAPGGRGILTVNQRRSKSANLETGEVYRESYDKLILSPGAHAVIPNLPGIDSETHLHPAHRRGHVYKVHGFVETARPASAVVVGGGFIGLEMAENLRDRGLDVTVVQRGGHVMPTLDADMAAIAHNHLRSHGVKLLLNSDVTGFEERADGAVQTNLAQSGPLAADMVVLAVGVAPESALAREAGLESGRARIHQGGRAYANQR